MLPLRTAPALLLAAGEGRRLGLGPKALLPYRAVRCWSTRCRCCVPAAARRWWWSWRGRGAGRRRGRPGRLHGGAQPRLGVGMGSSLRVGLEALPGTASAALVSLVDTPGVTAGAVARLLTAHRRGAQLAAAAYQGRRAHPVLIGAGYWAEAAAGAVGDSGARTLLRDHADELDLVECGDVAVPDDIDTAEAWAAWRERSRPRAD
ncbi:NTP transferase domain-containing protein [Streptacidiphilus sp. 4-A2]|nr:NTP transferase domain-containing protein [Streptacidiphilus sp. 4-A2]